MPRTIPEITKQYIGDKSLETFAKSLGIEASKQMAWYWKEGKQSPDLTTLFKVIGSKISTAEAKEWARECINAITGFEVELEDTLDKEIERRR